MSQVVEERARDILRAYSPEIVARGRAYAEQGRVRDITVDERGATAVVEGTDAYRVDLFTSRKSRCTCPAFARENECKHVAALAWMVQGVLRTPRVQPAALPIVFASVYSAATFFSRLSLYARERIGHDIEDYVPLADWWRRTSSSSAERLRQRAIEAAPELEAAIEALRQWRPRPLGGQTGFTELYGKLARIYKERTSNVRIGALLPGPFDERHPGFDIKYIAKVGIIEVRERASPYIEQPRELTINVRFDRPGWLVTFEGSAFADYGPADAWDMFALRALLLALRSREEPAVRELESELVRPAWEQLLDHLAPKKTAAAQREWSFVVSPLGGSVFTLAAFSRAISSSSAAKWRRERFETVFDDDVLPVEREIARAALVGERPGKNGVTFALGTAHGHEIVRHLAGHPRVFMASRHDRNGPENAFPLEVRAGKVTMALDRGAHSSGSAKGDFVPRFLVDGEPLSIPGDSLVGDRSSAFRGAAGTRSLLSLEIPLPLRSWFEMSNRFGASLSFPSDATAKLVSATQPLMAAGLVELPRAALGEELAYQPKAALRVEWKSSDEGIAAVLEVMIQPAEGSPFVATGRGPTLFAFEQDGVRVFVERDLRQELTIAGAVIDDVDLPIQWIEGVGRVEDTTAALELATWLEQNPLKLPIEIKVGKSPVLRTLADDLRGKLVVRKIGAWLRMDGAFEVGQIKISLGEMLEAIRHARRYVRIGDGSFVELSKEVVAKLSPLAIASGLAPPSEKTETEVVVHDGFGALVPSLSEMFETVKGDGIDLSAYLERFNKRVRKVATSKLTSGELRDYQRDGVSWMLSLSEWAPGCVLADDMGLGKTVQTAAVLGARAKLGPALVIAPASVSSNWVLELRRFMSRLNVRWYNEDRKIVLDELGPNDVLVVSYNLLQRSSEPFRERHWSTVVIDEAQYVKNIAAERRKVVRDLSRDFTIALTGTPLENHLGELFSIVDLVFPGLLGDADTFRDVFRRPIEAHREGERVAMLGSLIGPFLLRRTRANVLRELPPREDITEYVDLSLPERKRYLALRKACEESLKKKTAETPAHLRIALLAALTRLRQMACDVALVEPTFTQPSTKIARTVELARQLADEGNAVLVFSQFTRFLEKVRAALAEAGLRVAMLTGDTPTTARRPLIDAFQAGEHDVFCVSLLAGGTGLNLTKASYVIHLDPWWNPAAEEQATSRAYRMGQMKPVTVYRLVSRATIEEAVLELHADKRELAAAVLEGKGNPKAISADELLGLLRFAG